MVGSSLLPGNILILVYNSAVCSSVRFLVYNKIISSLENTISSSVRFVVYDYAVFGLCGL